MCSLHKLFQQVFDVGALCAYDTGTNILGEGTGYRGKSSATRPRSSPGMRARTTYMGPNLMTLYLSQLMSATGRYLENFGVYEPTERTPFTSPVALFLDGAGGGGEAAVVEIVLVEEVLAMLVEDVREVAVVASSVEDAVVEVAVLS